MTAWLNDNGLASGLELNYLGLNTVIRGITVRGSCVRDSFFQVNMRLARTRHSGWYYAPCTMVPIADAQQGLPDNPAGDVYYNCNCCTRGCARPREDAKCTPVVAEYRYSPM